MRDNLSKSIDYCDIVYVNVTWEKLEWENRLLWDTVYPAVSKCYMTEIWVRELLLWYIIVCVKVTWDLLIVSESIDYCACEYSCYFDTITQNACCVAFFITTNTPSFVCLLVC
jgi:hypothetical protein